LFMAWRWLCSLATADTNSQNTCEIRTEGSRKMKHPSHPATRYQPPDNPNYSYLTVRKNLSGPALRRFFRIMQKWQIGAKDARLLPGGIGSKCYKQLSTRPDGRIVNSDQLLRVTCVIAMNKALRNLLPRRQAYKWTRMSRPDHTFAPALIPRLD
jgi:hypothetical protein